MKKKKNVIEGQDYVIRAIPLPTAKIHGMIVSNCDDCATIIINSRCSEQTQKETLKHELSHLKNDDLYNETDSLIEIESRCRNI